MTGTDLEHTESYLEGEDLALASDQDVDHDDLVVALDDLEILPEVSDSDHAASFLEIEGLDDSPVLEVSDSEPDEMLMLTLDLVPGGEDQEEWVTDADGIEVEDDKVEIEDDWAWTPATFLKWLSTRMKSVPPHSGRDSVGLERAMAYLEALDREISKAVRADLKNQIDVGACEKAREEIRKGLERLSDRLDKILSSKFPKRRKKADFSPGLVKEGKIAGVGGPVVTVPLLISSLARSCINGAVSAGHDLEGIYHNLCDEYSLTKREKLELMQLLQDMGYHVRRDLGMPLDEEIDTTSSDNVNWAANYSA